MFAAGIRQLLGFRSGWYGCRSAAPSTSRSSRASRPTLRRGLRRAPLLAWRLGTFVSATRDLVRIAMPLKIFAPPFLWLTFFAVVACVILVGVGLISLIVLAVS